jgi:carnitine O-acetyltransferase
MFFKPLIALFLPQTQRTARLTATLTPFRLGVDDVEKVNQTSQSDEFPFEDPWEGKTVVESDGNYLGETFLEQGPLYANQDNLPSLPVPSLAETIKGFLPSALPLAESEEEEKTLQEACDAFDRQAKVLQDRLEERFLDCQRKKTSWLQELWQTDAYLKWRAPLNFYSSYYFLLNDPDEQAPLWESTADAGIVKAAALCRAAVDYADQVTSAVKTPDVIGKKKAPICSVGYKYMFNACRIPKLAGADTCRIYNPRMHRHAIVACRGHFFEIPLEDIHGLPLNRFELEDLLYECESKATVKDPAFLELGWLTTWNRDDWAKARDFLLEPGGSDMVKAFERLESALFVINLDVDTVATSLQDQALNFWHGGLVEGMNRWWDKPLQLAVTRNGKWAYLGEHSMVDGMLPVDFCQYLLEHGTFDPHGRVPEDEAAPLTPGPAAIDVFQKAVSGLSDADLEDIQERIGRAKSDFLKLTDELTMNVHHCDTYGSELIKKAGVSSDAYVQMAIQLAAHRMFGKLVATYESTQTRSFLHGRTEATRTVSPAALAFCKAMGKEHSQVRSPETRQELLKLLQQAAFCHVKHSKKSAMGQGVDRHFFGLSKMIQNEDETPDLFKHPLFDRSKHWRLSTSTIPTSPGFGMVVDDGLGVGYTVFDNNMVFNIAARTETGYAQKFGRLLGEALEDMKNLV